jgi:hypothetical protein
MLELDHYNENSTYSKLDSEHYQAVDNHILKKDQHDSDSVDSHNSGAEVEVHHSHGSSHHSENDGDGCSDLESRSAESDDTITREGLQVKSTPQIEILQDWLFSEEVPFFNKNEYIKQAISKNDQLEIFFRIICSPLKYPLEAKAKKKYGKLTQNLHPDLKHTRPLDEEWVYSPEKHNIYYLRARRMMIIFLFKPNINTLMSVNKNFVDVFYSVLNEEIWEFPKARANMDWIFKLIQYFLLIDISGS